MWIGPKCLNLVNRSIIEGVVVINLTYDACKLDFSEILKIDGLCELYKIDELSVLMNYDMMSCSWWYDEDNVMW